MDKKSNRTLVGYCLRSGDVRGQGQYWRPDTGWVDDRRVILATDSTAGMPLFITSHCRWIRVYRRKVETREEIEAETVRRIGAWMRKRHGDDLRLPPFWLDVAVKVESGECKHHRYREAIAMLAYALEQAILADVEDRKTPKDGGK